MKRIIFFIFLNILLLVSFSGAQEFSNEEAHADEITLDAAGDKQQTQSAPTLDLTITLQELSWAKLLELLPSDLAEQLDHFGLSGLGRVTIQPKGSLDNLVISGEFDLSSSGIHYQNLFVKPDTERALLGFHVGIQGSSLDLSSLSLALGELVLNLSGTVSDFKQPVLDLEVESNEFSLTNLFSFFPDLAAALPKPNAETFQLGGGGSLQASAKGPVDDLELSLGINLDHSAISFKDLFRKTAQSPGNLTVHGHLGDDGASLQEVSLNLGSFQLTARGDVHNFHAPEFDVELETNFFELDALLQHFPIVAAHYLPKELALSGAGKLELASKGSLDDLDISGAVDVGQASIVFGEYFHKKTAIPGRLDLDLRLTKDALDIRTMQLNLNDLLLDLKGMISGWQQETMLDLSVTAPPLALEQLLEFGLRDDEAGPGLASQYQGQVEIGLQLQGSVASPRGSAHIGLKHLEYQGQSVPDIILDVSLAQQQLQANLGAFQDMLKASFEVAFTPELPYRAEVIVEKADVERLLALVSDQEGVSGSMSGQLFSEGDLKDLSRQSAELSMSELSLDLFGRAFQNTQPIELILTQQQLAVNSFEVAGDGLKIFSQGVVDFQGESRLDLDGILDLRCLQAFLPPKLGIASLDGRIHLLCSLEGNLKEPHLLGMAEIHHGSVQSLIYPDPIANINGRVILTPGKIAIPKLLARVSQGDVRLLGELSYRRGKPERFSLELEGERLRLKDLVDSLEMTVSPSLSLSGTSKRQVLDGDIVIHEALYDRDLDAIVEAAQQEKARNISLVTRESLNSGPQASTAPSSLILDLAIKTARGIQVRNRQALLDLRADLKVMGAPAQPGITGLVEVVKGSFYLFNVRYHVLSARLDFFDSLRINPEFNILLETLIQQHNITVGLDGNLERLSLDLSSDPFLSENEILALLLQGAQRHLRFVQGPFIDWMEKASRELFALDRVTLETTPVVLQGRMTQSPTLTLVKRIFDKLLLTYITSVGGSDKFQIFQGEYEFSEKLSAEIRGNEKGDIDTGLSYEFRMK